MLPTVTLSTSEARRETVIRSAVTVFARLGYLGTPVSAIAEHAEISTAYVFKLFPRKEDLFVAAIAAVLRRCSQPSGVVDVTRGRGDCAGWGGRREPGTVRSAAPVTRCCRAGWSD